MRPIEHHPSPRRWFAGTVLLVLVVLGTSCSSESKADEATDQVCASRTKVMTATEKVSDDLKSANLGQAHDDFGALRTAFDDLVSDTKDLDTAKRDELQPEIDELKTSLDDLKDVTSIEELKAGVDGIGSQIDTLLSDIADTLDCS